VPSRGGKGKTASPDNTIAYVAIALVMFVASAFIAWLALRTPEPAVPAATYMKVGPVNFRVQDRSARVTLDLQSLQKDGTWAKQNYGALETVIESVLTDTSPEMMNAPNDVKFADLQGRLRKELNKHFPEAKVENVFVTDYVSSKD